MLSKMFLISHLPNKFCDDSTNKRFTDKFILITFCTTSTLKFLYAFIGFNQSCYSTTEDDNL